MLSSLLKSIASMFGNAAPTLAVPTPAALVSDLWLPLCLRLTIASEGCKLTAYPDPASGAEPWTIGYGATGADIHQGTVWTQAQAEARLQAYLARFGAAVDVVVISAITPNQKAALVDFAYNVGVGAFSQSTLLRLLNSGDLAGAAAQFNAWTYADGKQMPGLIVRRQRERDLFTTGDWK